MMEERAVLEFNRFFWEHPLTGLAPWNASWKACTSGQTQLLHEQIVSAGEVWNGRWQLAAATDDKKRTLLHIASRFGSAGCVRLLLDKGAKVDAEERYGATPLFFACEAGQLECAQLLFKHFATSLCHNLE